MKRIVLSIIGLALSVTPVSSLNGNPSTYASAARSFEDISEVNVEGPFKVFISTGASETTAELLGPPEMLADTITIIEDGKLVVRFREGAKWSWNPGSGMHVSVSLPSLTTIRSLGPSHVTVLGRVSGDFAAFVMDAGKVEIRDLEAGRVTFAVGGAGEVSASGKAKSASYALGGSGSIEAKRLRVGKAYIVNSGSGSIYADVTDTAYIGVGSAGDVEVVGGATCVTEAKDSSQIDCR